MRRVFVVALLLGLALARPVRADVADYLGLPITSIRLESEGRRIDDETAVTLLETEVGRPLTMRDVRASVAHLFSLGRFADVVVRARTAAGGVAISYELQPIHPITTIVFTGLSGASGIDRGDLRRAVEERFGSTPPAGRAQEMAGFVATRLRERGYRQAAVLPRVDLTHDPEQGTLVFGVTPGARTRVDDAEVTAPADIAAAAVVERLGLVRGTFYQPDLLQGRVDR